VYALSISTITQKLTPSLIELRTVLTIPEIRDELWRTFLGDKEVRDKLLAPGVRFAVY
jgi:hypothetical protein